MGHKIKGCPYNLKIQNAQVFFTQEEKSTPPLQRIQIQKPHPEDIEIIEEGVIIIATTTIRTHSGKQFGMILSEDL